MKALRQTVDLSAYPDLVVVYLGMTVNMLTGIKTLFGFGPKIEGSVAARPDGLLLHETLFYSLFPLLLTADLHFRLHWFRWLIEQAPEFDLVYIAGDLLDMFRSETRMEQAREIRTLVKKLSNIVPVAICSGNHDNAGRLVSHDRASLYEWFMELGTHRNIITDGSTRKLENLIVTTIPYHCSRQEKSIGLDRGSTIRRQTGMPWMFFTMFLPKQAWASVERN